MKSHMNTLTLRNKSESDESISYSPNFTVTKSGRNVNKPSQFNPAPQPATPSTPGGGHRGRRSYRRGPEFALCAKCARGHSPISNLVVFCDGCNAAYHQWCHDPPIGREVIEVETASWFCAKCSSQKELDECPLDKRLSSEQINLTPDEVRKPPVFVLHNCDHTRGYPFNVASFPALTQKHNREYGT